MALSDVATEVHILISHFSSPLLACVRDTVAVLIASQVTFACFMDFRSYVE